MLAHHFLIAALGAGAVMLACPQTTVTVTALTDMPSTARYTAMVEEQCGQSEVRVGQQANPAQATASIGYYRLAGAGALKWWCNEPAPGSVSEEATECPAGSTLVRVTRTPARQGDRSLFFDCADEGGTGSADRLDLVGDPTQHLVLVRTSMEACGEPTLRVGVTGGELSLAPGQSMTGQVTSTGILGWDCGTSETDDETNCHFNRVVLVRATLIVGDRDFRIDCFGS